MIPKCIGFIAGLFSSVLFSHGLNGVCQNTCTTYSHHLHKMYDDVSVLECSVQNRTCNNTDEHVSHLLRNLPANIPQKQHGRIKPRNWYLYADPETNNYKIALNFSWFFTHDNSLERVQGYSVTFFNTKTTLNITIHFCIFSNLVFQQHALTKFHYDCYGVSNATPVIPGDQFKIIINTLPESPGANLTFMVDIPDCSSGIINMVNECITKSKLYVRVMQIYCSNKTVQFAYNVPTEYGRKAQIVVCQGEDDGIQPCISTKLNLSEQMLSHVIWKKVSENNFGYKGNYTILVFGNIQNHFISTTSFSFKQCSTPVIPYYSIILASVLLFIIVLCGIIFLYKRKEKYGLNLKEMCSLNEQNSVECIEPLNEGHCCNIVESFQQTSVYIVFCNDHPKHCKVVDCFARFLKTDYNFNVIFELWEEDKVFQNISLWMENSLQSADKVLVIWSPGATKRWESNMSSSEPRNNSECDYLWKGLSDTFTPVVRQIFFDMFCEGNQGKYFLAFFDYGDAKCIPVTRLQKRVCKTYNLMSDFDQLYFQFRNQEIHVPGGKARVESGRTCKDNLHNAIKEMQTLVQNCEDWHSITNNAANNHADNFLLPLPTKNLFHVHPPVNVDSQEVGLLQQSYSPVVETATFPERHRPPVLPLEPLNNSSDAYRELEELNRFQSSLFSPST